MVEMLCNIFESQPCGYSSIRVVCCRCCSNYENCTAGKCYNNPAVCGCSYTKDRTEYMVTSKCNRKGVIGKGDGVILTFKSITEAAKYCGISRDKMRTRIDKGWLEKGMVWSFDVGN